jgi:hypothetical protein
MNGIRRSGLVLSAALLGCLGAPSARADFFDDARQTFQKDIPHFFQNDVPHFFQDDIPCAFGGQPTSHTRKYCKDRENSARRPAENPGRAPTAPADAHPDARQAPVYDE